MPTEKQSFQWRRALSESFTFLVIEQAYVVDTDFSWVVSENGIPFGVRDMPPLEANLDELAPFYGNLDSSAPLAV